jgi:hypothetical protein
MSQSGQYQLAVQSSVASYSVVKSSDSGVTWQTLTNGANGLPKGAVAYPQATATGNPAYTSVSYSATGQYALAAASGGLLYVSNNATVATPTFTAIGPTAPTIYMPFEGSTADVIGTVSPAAAPTVLGTNAGSIAYVTGAVGTQAINLANTAGSTAVQYVRGTWTAPTSCTISVWFQPRTISGVYQYIFSTYSTAISVSISNANVISCAFPTGTTTGQTVISTTYTASVNTWYNATLIFVGGGTCSFYVNNVLIGTSTNSGGFGTFTSNATFGLGTYDNAQTNCFNGYIDDLRIYNSAITFSPITPANWSHTAVSATGQYMLAAASPSGGGGGLFQSTNYGQTWTQVNAVLNGGVWNSLSQSASGQYALATTSAASITPQLTSLAVNTWSTNGVSWAASGSPNLSTYYPYKMFNNTGSSSWAALSLSYNTTSNASGIYTIIQGVGTVQGDYVQLQSSIPLVIYSYQFAVGGIAEQLPKTYYIIGSNDGTTWYPIQYGAGGPTATSTGAGTIVPGVIIANTSGVQTFGSSYFTTTSYSTTNNTYTYFRFVGLTTYNTTVNTALEIGEWYINFVGGLAYTSNYGQTWSNASNTLFADSSAISGDGQYTLGISNQLLPYAYLPLDGTKDDSRGGLTNATNGTGSGAVTFPGTIYKVGTNAALIPNTAGAGSSLSYLNYTVPTALNSPSTLSVSFWIYIGANPASGQSCPLGFNNGTTTAGPYFYINTSGIIGYAYYTNTPSTSYIQSTTSITLNAWNHVVGVVSSGMVSLYLNNVFQATATLTGSLSLNGGTSITNLFIGCVHTTSGGFAGYIDDVRIYTSALTPTAIAELYAVPALNPIPLLNLGSNYLMGIGGFSYTPITLPNLNANINCASCSNTGQYMTVLTQGTTNNVYYSTNYGSTWTALTVGSSAMTSCAVSADGTYITVSNATNVYTLNWNSQGYTLAIGAQAGAVNQANNAIAIGNQAGQTNQTANSIVLNASGAAVNPYTQGFYVAPIAQAISSLAPTFPLLGYGSDNQIVQSATSFSNLQQTVYGEWIQYQLATPSPITSYTLQGRTWTGGSLAHRYPASWIIVGSNDGTNWTLLDTQTGTSGWGTYILTQAIAPYTYYRMIMTQLSSASSNGSSYTIDIGGWILNNGTPLFGPNANYTVSAGPNNYYNILQFNGSTVCTTTFSWSAINVFNTLGIIIGNTIGSNYFPGWAVTPDGYTKGVNFYIGFAALFGPAYEYNSSGTTFQGTSTTINTTVLGNTNMAGTLCLMGGSRVGIGSTMPQYTLDVAGTAQVNGPIPAAGQPDSAAVVPNSTFGQTWTQVSGLATGTALYGCAVSATGQYMTVFIYGAASGNNIYYSTNYGSAWTLATGFLANAGYFAIGMSGNGQYQLATIDLASSALYVSSNYGATWSATAYTIGTAYGRNVCLSYNGQYQFAATVSTGYVVMSSNYGATFANSSLANGSWTGVCCSSSGQYVSACASGGSIWYSSNYGATWTSSGVANASWGVMCCSSSGQYQIANASSNYIYYSNNYGVSWTASNLTKTGWGTMACTSSGQYMVAAVNNNYVYYSTNYGVTWTQSGTPSGNWTAVAISQNGLYTLACIYGGAGAYLSTLTNVSLLTNGRVGIGLTTPPWPLSVIGTNFSCVTGTNVSATLTIAGNYGNAGVSQGITGGYIEGGTNYYTSTYMAFGINSGTTGSTKTERMRITDSGNVGIGTTNPTAALHVNGTIKCTTIVSTSFTVTASSLATVLITNSSLNGYAGSTVIMITVNGVNLSVNTFGGGTVTASAYVAWDSGAPSYANVYGMVATRGDISITSSSYGVNFNVPSSSFYISYYVTILRIS